MDSTETRGVNIPLLRKAVEWAEAEAAKPEQYSSWWQVDTVTPAQELGRAPECGTCYCIAGFVAMVETGYEDPYLSPEVAAGGSVCDFAAERLRLPGGDEFGLQSLFAMDNTIEDVRRIAEDLAGERL